MPKSSLAPVLVAVGRTGSGAAVRAGAAEARRTRRPLRLVHVAPPGDTWLRMVAPDTVGEALRLGREEVLDRTTCEHEVLRGDVLEQLRRRARGAAMLVIERSDGGRHLRGDSTTVRLAESVETTVLVVPGTWTPSHHAVVTVGLDPRAPDDTALRTAMMRARLTGSVLRVLVAGEVARAEVEERLDRLGADACDVAVEITSGSAVGALVEASTTSDLVVLGRHAPKDRHDGDGVGHLLVEHIACPVLLCPPGHVHVPGTTDLGPGGPGPADPAGRDRRGDTVGPRT